MTLHREKILYVINITMKLWSEFTNKRYHVVLDFTKRLRRTWVENRTNYSKLRLFKQKCYLADKVVVTKMFNIKLVISYLFLLSLALYYFNTIKLKFHLFLKKVYKKVLLSVIIVRNLQCCKMNSVLFPNEAEELVE